MRVLLSSVALVAFANGAWSQQQSSAARHFPVTAPVRDAGRVDVTTGQWERSQGSLKAGSQVVYNNTCTWAGGGYYAGAEPCEDLYDEGRVPSPSAPNAPLGAEVSNDIQSFQVSYCTFAGPLAGSGGYDMEVAFWDNLGGTCVGGVPPTPPAASSTATAYFNLAGLGLPGSSAVGFQACWLVTIDTSNAGFVLASDGNGTYSGTPAQDLFTWSQSQNSNLSQPGGSSDGFFIAGEPLAGGYGVCTYDIPCGPGLCGTGLDTDDGLWINVDGVGVGSSTGPVNCPNSYGSTNCYFFGGYPTNPLASLWLVLESDGRAGPALYCAQSKPTSVAGCTASLSVSDLTLATGSWNATDIPRAANLGAGNVLGIFIYTNAPGAGISAFSANVPFGLLCLSGFKRSAPACAPALLVGAQPGVCNTGVMSTALNCSGGALGISVGDDVNAQLWYRDPGSLGGADANLSNGIFYTVQ